MMLHSSGKTRFFKRGGVPPTLIPWQFDNKKFHGEDMEAKISVFCGRNVTEKCDMNDQDVTLFRHAQERDQRHQKYLTIPVDKGISHFSVSCNFMLKQLLPICVHLSWPFKRSKRAKKRPQKTLIFASISSPWNFLLSNCQGMRVGGTPLFLKNHVFPLLWSIIDSHGVLSNGLSFCEKLPKRSVVVYHGVWNFLYRYGTVSSPLHWGLRWC